MSQTIQPWIKINLLTHFTQNVFHYTSDTAERLLSINDEIRDWCKENCRGKFRNEAALLFEFKDEDDIMLFKLRWYSNATL